MTALVKDGAEQRSPKHFRFITYVGMMGATLRSWVLCRSGGSSSGPVDVTTDVNVAGSSHPHSGTQGGGKSSSGPVNVDASVNVAGSSHPHSGTQGGGGSSSGPVNVDASVNVPGYVDASVNVAG